MLLKLYALHGFLGRPQDWEEILPSHQSTITIDPYAITLPGPQCCQNNWAAKFNAQITRNNSQPKPILMGYSMGGRLAMHALLQAPEKWAGAVIISAHPGLPNSQEREKRFLHDCAWADRFAHEDWTILMRDWNAQSTFIFDDDIVRHEKDYSRKICSDTLRYWSLGRQALLIEKISQLPMPILWIAGEKDAPYVAMAKKMSFAHHQSQVWIAPEVGHRVPWACKNLFQKKLQEFLNKI